MGDIVPLARKDLSLWRDRPAADRQITRHHNAPEVDFTSEESAALECARESLGVLKKTFAHWITIGRAVQICRARAEAIGGKETFHRLLEQSGFGGLADRKGKNALSYLEKIMQPDRLPKSCERRPIPIPMTSNWRIADSESLLPQSARAASTRARIGVFPNWERMRFASVRCSRARARFF